jgi:hypothetical protein
MLSSTNKVITIDEAVSKYPRQWLGLKVIERDKDSGQPLKVEVLSRNMNLHGVRNEMGVDNICTMYTGPIPEVRHIALF